MRGAHASNAALGVALNTDAVVSLPQGEWVVGNEALLFKSICFAMLL